MQPSYLLFVLPVALVLVQAAKQGQNVPTMQAAKGQEKNVSAIGEEEDVVLQSLGKLFGKVISALGKSAAKFVLKSPLLTIKAGMKVEIQGGNKDNDTVQI